MMHINSLVAGLLIAFASTKLAQAQMSLDVAKITCDQYVHQKVGNPRTIAAWLSGYYSAKRNDLTVDLQALQALGDRVQSYCGEQSNWKVPLMQAIERLAASK